MDGVENDYIEKALSELFPVLGIKEYVNQDRLLELIGSGKVKAAIKSIALYLGLPIDVNITYVPKGYHPGSSDGFTSNYLVKTDQNHKGTAGITAQVSIPPNLPLFGTTGMVDFLINVRLSEDCAENPSTLISVIAHEFSHVVLHSIWHQEKNNEYYTDLTAMLLGFAEIIKTGRKVVKTTTSTNQEWGSTTSTTTTHTETTTYGYLSDENFNFAFNQIDSFIIRQRSIKKELFEDIRQSKKNISDFQKQSFYFEKYLEYLDKNPNHKIGKNDGSKISAFHQPDYIYNCQSVCRNNEAILAKILGFLENINLYSEQNIESLKRYKNQIKSSDVELVKHYSLLTQDVNVLKRYTSFFYKIKVKTGK